MEGRWLLGLGQVSLFLLVAGGIFYLALSAAERLYYTGWARIQVGGMKKKTARSAPVQAAQAAPLLTRLTGWIPNPVRGIMIKDWILMRRDLRNFSQLITPLIFGVVYGFVLLGNRGEVPPGRGEMPAQVELGLSHLLIYANIGLTLFVCWMIQSRLALMGFSAEGKSYWLLRASPIPPGRLLLAKFLVAFLPTLLLGWLFLIAISLAQNSSPQVFIYGLGVVAFSIAGAVGVNLSFGVTGARTDWEDPRHMLRSTTGCLASLASFAYLFVCLVCFFGPPLAVVFLGGTELRGYIIGMVLGGVVSLACAVIPPRLVIQRVARVGEE
jgi:hypothetical protein